MVYGLLVFNSLPRPRPCEQSRAFAKLNRPHLNEESPLIVPSQQCAEILESQKKTEQHQRSPAALATALRADIWNGYALTYV